MGIVCLPSIQLPPSCFLIPSAKTTEGGNKMAVVSTIMRKNRGLLTVQGSQNLSAVVWETTLVDVTNEGRLIFHFFGRFLLSVSDV